MNLIRWHEDNNNNPWSGRNLKREKMCEESFLNFCLAVAIFLGPTWHTDQSMGIWILNKQCKLNK